jgi:hypothetical protein
MLDHPQPALWKFQLFANQTIEASRSGMMPNLGWHGFFTEGMVHLFSRERGIERAGPPPGRCPWRPRFLIRWWFWRRRLVVRSRGDKAFAPRPVQLALQTRHFRHEFVDACQELIDARFQRFDLLGLSQNQGVTVGQIVGQFHRLAWHHDTFLDQSCTVGPKRT